MATSCRPTTLLFSRTIDNFFPFIGPNICRMVISTFQRGLSRFQSPLQPIKFGQIPQTRITDRPLFEPTLCVRKSLNPDQKETLGWLARSASLYALARRQVIQARSRYAQKNRTGLRVWSPYSVIRVRTTSRWPLTATPRWRQICLGSGSEDGYIRNPVSNCTGPSTRNGMSCAMKVPSAPRDLERSDKESMPAGRLRISPNAPFAEWRHRNMIVPVNLGPGIFGSATSNLPS